MQDEFMLSSRNSNRVTYAAVFLPSAKNPDQEIKYLLPENVRRTKGFKTYNKSEHHRDHEKGEICCGNCYEEGKKVPVHHRGDTWSAYPNTIEDHTDKCKQRRTSAGRTEQGQMIRWNIDIPETGSTSAPSESLSSVDQNLDKRTGRAVHQSLQEMIDQASTLTRQQAQDALYVVGNRGILHKNMMIDGDNWKRMVQGERRSAYDDNLFRLFHVTIVKSQNIRDFADAASRKRRTTKIDCERYTFTDQEGTLHVVQPHIKTTSDAVRAVFEKRGDYFVLSPVHHTPRKAENGTMIHDLVLDVLSPQFVAELYGNPNRKISDYNAFHNLQMPMKNVAVWEPQQRINFPKVAAADPAQADMFAATDGRMVDVFPH